MLTTLYFTGAVNNTWDTTTANWSNGTSAVVWSNGDTAAFSGTGGTVNIAEGVAISATEIDFAPTSGSYNITAGTDGSLAVTGSGTIDVAPGTSNTISAPLVGSDGLTLDDTGTLILNAANSFTGATVIDGGTLQLANALALRSSTSVSALATGTLDLYGQTIGSAVPLDDFAGTLTNSAIDAPASFAATINATTQDTFAVSGNSDITLSAAVYGSSTTTLIKTGGNTLTIADATEYDGLSINIEDGNVVQAGNTTMTTLNIGAGTTMTIAPSGGGISYGTNLYWDPTHSDSATAGGSGDWNTSDAYWYNPATGEDQTWDNSGAYTAIFAGTAGTVTLDTTISADTLSFQSDGYVLNSASDADTLTTGGYGISVGAGMTDTVNADLTGSNGLSKIGTGTLIVGGSDNTYTGATSILYGTLALSSSAALGDSTYVSARPSATLDLNGQDIGDTASLQFFEGTLTNSNTTTAASFAGAVNYNAFISYAPNFTITGNSDITLRGPVDEYGSTLTVAMAGSNTLILSGSDDNVGLNLAVNSGTVELDKSSGSSVHAIESGLTIDGGTVEFSGTGTEQIDDSVQIGIGYGGAALDMNGTDQTVNSLVGDGNLSITGSGTLTLIDTSSNTGTTMIDSGATLLADAPGALSPTSDFVVDGTLDLYGTDQTIGSLSGTGTVTNSGSTVSILTVGADGNYTEFDGTLADDSGGLGLTVIGGQLTLGGDNTYTGGTILDGGGLQLGNGTTGYDGLLAGNITDNGALTFDYYSNEDFYGVITGTGSVTNSGPGIVTLNAASTYYGPTTVDAYATLQAGVPNAFSADSDYTVNANGTLDLAGYSQTIGSLSGSISATVKSSTSAATLTTQADGNSTEFSGTIENGSGSVELIVAGAGELVLTGSQTYTGGTTIDEGGTLQLGDGATANGSVDENITDNGTLVFANPDSQNFTGAISGSGDLIVAGPGELTLSGSSSYTGATAVVADVTLAAGATDALSDASNFTILGTLDLAGYGQTIGSLAGNGTVESSTGTAILRRPHPKPTTQSSTVCWRTRGAHSA